jgi:hypothetical protein
MPRSDSDDIVMPMHSATARSRATMGRVELQLDAASRYARWEYLVSCEAELRSMQGQLDGVRARRSDVVGRHHTLCGFRKFCPVLFRKFCPPPGDAGGCRSEFRRGRDPRRGKG